jgi:hypothetical protein
MKQQGRLHNKLKTKWEVGEEINWVLDLHVVVFHHIVRGGINKCVTSDSVIKFIHGVLEFT